MAKQKTYKFEGKVWKYKGHAGWYFVTLPQKLSVTIRDAHSISEEGWGRLKVSAIVGDLEWQTAIWYDTKAKGYLLPIKASVRKTAAIDKGALISVTLVLEAEKPRFQPDQGGS